MKTTHEEFLQHNHHVLLCPIIYALNMLREKHTDYYVNENKTSLLLYTFYVNNLHPVSQSNKHQKTEFRIFTQ